MTRTIIALCFLLSGCTIEPLVISTPVPFDRVEMQPYTQSGTCVINGSVFARTQGGDVRTGAGLSVYCYPATRQVLSIMQDLQQYERIRERRHALLHSQCIGLFDAVTLKRYVSNQVPVLYDSTLTGALCERVRVSVCDEQGRFTFAGLPAGTYYLECGLSWLLYNGQYDGATIRKVVVVQDFTTVMMTP